MWRVARQVGWFLVIGWVTVPAAANASSLRLGPVFTEPPPRIDVVLRGTNEFG